MPNPDTLTARQAMLALSALPRLGPVTIRRLLAAFADDPVAVLRAPQERLRRVERIGAETAAVLADWRNQVDPWQIEAKLERSGTEFVSLQDAAYPLPLKHIYDPPVGLYCKGPLRPGVKSVAIVGSRRTTLYGQSTAQMLGRELASLGFCVVSGMARGIDTAAHKGALSVGGQTVAVLGCGVDIVYPPENIDLYQQIAAKGVLMSELPPGTRASRTTFPMRNRLISGLSAAVIVVETDKQGGSMITARFAAEHNRPLFAVPGRIDSSTSQGCNQLIREGAILLTSVDDLIEELAYGGRPVVSSAARTGADNRFDPDEPQHHQEQPSLDFDELQPPAPPQSQPRGNDDLQWQAGLDSNAIAVLGALRERGRLDRDALAAHAGLPVSAVSASLLLLELKRKVAKRADGTFEAY